MHESPFRTLKITKRSNFKVFSIWIENWQVNHSIGQMKQPDVRLCFLEIFSIHNTKWKRRKNVNTNRLKGITPRIMVTNCTKLCWKCDDMTTHCKSSKHPPVSNTRWAFGPVSNTLQGSLRAGLNTYSGLNHLILNFDFQFHLQTLVFDLVSDGDYSKSKVRHRFDRITTYVATQSSAIPVVINFTRGGRIG